jgi:hypothetical protein
MITASAKRRESTHDCFRLLPGENIAVLDSKETTVGFVFAA